MKLARIERAGLAGPEPRVVALDLDRGVAIDVQRAEQTRLERLGCTAEAALRLARARLPGSLAAGLGSVSYREDLEQAVASGPPDDAVVALDEVNWLACESVRLVP